MKIISMLDARARELRRENLDELRGVLHEITTGPGAPPQVLARATAFLRARVAALEAEGL